ncbi:MAG: DUF1588 domain-containing protein [Myxococcota bacterium]
MLHRQRLIGLLCATAATSCYVGSSWDPAGSAGDAGPPPQDADPSDTSEPEGDDPEIIEEDLAPPRFVRLDAAGYSASITSLFDGRPPNEDTITPIRTDIATPFAWINPIDRFSTRSRSYHIDNEDFIRVVRNADTLAADYIAVIEQERPECLDAGGSWPTCQQEVLAEVVSLLYRRPASPTEIEELMAIEPTSESPTPKDYLDFSLQAALSNANFLFRPEVGQPDDDAPRASLTTFELASTLSFTLTGGPPDVSLYAAAEDGSLADDEIYADHVERLLSGAAHRARVLRFAQEYWRYGMAQEIAKDLDPIDVFPDGTPGADKAKYRPNTLVEDTDALLHRVIETSLTDDFLATMLTTTEGFVTADSAIFYNQTSESEDRVLTSFSPQERQGIMMQPSWLVAFSEPDHNSPIRRGLFIQESMLCGQIPEIPIDGVPPLELSEDKTLRETLEIHLDTEASCSACHLYMDPLGLPLEQFDLFGRHRVLEVGAPVDTTGTLAWLGGEFDGEGDVADPFEMMARLAESRHVTRCFVAHAYEFWMGRSVEEYDLELIEQATAAYLDEGGNFNAALRQILNSNVFKHRSIP